VLGVGELCEALAVGLWLLAIVALGDGEGEAAAVGPAAPHAVANTARAARPASLTMQEA
jgi:hypothetical protein